MDDKLQRILSRTTLYPEKIEKLPEFGIIKLPDHYEEVVKNCIQIYLTKDFHLGLSDF